jgi:hypothetical protein
MSKLSDALKHIPGASAIVDFDEDTKPAPVPTKPVSEHPAFNLTPGAFSAAPAVPASGSPFAVPSTVVIDEGVYQSILKKTNFDATSVGQTIHKYYDALEGTGMDPNARFKAALKQAAALDHIAPDQVLATFDQLTAALEKDAQGFAGVASSVEAKEITARQQKLQDIAQQIAQLQQQQTQVQGELVDAQTTHANATAQYNMAKQRREQEITAQKAQFAALLK